MVRIIRERKIGGVIGGTTGAIATRNASEWPFAAEDVGNIGFGVNAVFEGLTGRTKMVVTAPQTPTINAANPIWTLQYDIAPGPTVTIKTNQSTISGLGVSGSSTASGDAAFPYAWSGLLSISPTFQPAPLLTAASGTTTSVTVPTATYPFTTALVGRTIRAKSGANNNGTKTITSVVTVGGNVTLSWSSAYGTAVADGDIFAFEKGDGWCTVLQPDGTLLDAYQLSYEGVGLYSARYLATSNIKGTAYSGGTRASARPLLSGVMTQFDFARWIAGGHIGHALSLAISQNLLRRDPIDLTTDPVDGDGKVIATRGTYSRNITTTSTTSVTLSNAAKSFTVGTGLGLAAGNAIVAFATTGGVKNGNMLFGQVTSYTSGTGALVITPVYSSDVMGSGTFSTWIIESAQARWGYVFPSHSADSSTMYGNPVDSAGVNQGVSMGAVFGIPNVPGVSDLTTLTSALGLTAAGVELAYTLQNYGAIIGAVGQGMLLNATPEVAATHAALLADMTGDWVKLFPYLRRLKASNNPPAVTWNTPIPPPSELGYIMGGGGATQDPRVVPTAPIFTGGI